MRRRAATALVGACVVLFLSSCSGDMRAPLLDSTEVVDSRSPLTAGQAHSV